MLLIVKMSLVIIMLLIDVTPDSACETAACRVRHYTWHHMLMHNNNDLVHMRAARVTVFGLQLCLCVCIPFSRDSRFTLVGIIICAHA